MYNAHGSKSSFVTFQLQFQNFGVIQRTAWRHYSIDVLRDVERFDCSLRSSFAVPSPCQLQNQLDPMIPLMEPWPSSSLKQVLLLEKVDSYFYVFLEFQGSVSLAKTCSNTPDMGQLTATSPKSAALWNLYIWFRDVHRPNVISHIWSPYFFLLQSHHEMRIFVSRGSISQGRCHVLDLSPCAVAGLQTGSQRVGGDILPLFACIIENMSQNMKSNYIRTDNRLWWYWMCTQGNCIQLHAPSLP